MSSEGARTPSQPPVGTACLVRHALGRRSLRSACFVALGASLLVGCGGRDDKVVVQGKVTLDGQRVMNGDIRFVPEPGTPGATALAPIVDGAYQVVNKEGVPVGKHRVILRAFVVEGVGSAEGAQGAGQDMLSGPAAAPASKPALPVYRAEGRLQFLPPEYNERAGLVVEVTGEQNPQIEDFNLKSAS